MANYDDLITSIDAVIKSNNRREITGQILQNTLNQMVSSLGENYQLAGVATPTTNPHDPDQNVFYIASEAGVYSYFDNIQVSDGLTLLMWKNGHWTAETIDVVTKEWLDANYVTKAYFSQLFKAYDEDGFEIVPNDTQSIVDNIKAMVGLWTEQYLSALGKGDDGGGSGQGDVTWALLASPAQEGRYIDASYIMGTLTSYATKQWVNGQGFATQQWVNAQGFATITQLNALEYYNTIASDMGVIVFTTNKGNSMVVDLSHQHSFLELLDRPTTVEGYGITNIPAWAMAANKPSYTFSEIGSKPSTIAGYGINDAYISDGVIRLGSNTITPITSLAMTVPTGFAVSGSPVSKTGTLAISYASGYEGFMTAWKNDIKDKVDFLYSLFELDADGNIKAKDYVVGGVTKHRGIWTDSFMSALGKGDDSGGGGAGDVTWALLAAPAQGGRYIDASYIAGALSGYATQSWVTGQGYATQLWVTAQGYATQAALNALEYLNSITGGNGFVTFGTNKGNSTVIDFTHEHTFLELLDRPTTVKGYGITDIPAWAMAANKPSYSFNEISGVAAASQIPTLDWSKIGTGKPTTLAGYGISDALISNGVITLGSNTITPITSLNMTVPTGFSVSGVPVSKTGTIALSYASGYEGFTTELKNKINALYSWFEVDENGDIKTKDYVDGGQTKHRGFWTNSFISALGQGNDSGGGGGQGDVTWELLKQTAASDRWIDHSYIAAALTGYATESWVTGRGYITSAALNGYATQSWVQQQGYITTAALTGYATQSWVQQQGYITSNALVGYATQTWVQQQGYATQTSVNALEFLNAIAGGEGYATFTTNKGNATTLDWSHQHSFMELINRPTTVKGYGITDIPSWSMAASKPSYSFSEIGGVASSAQIPSLDWSKITTGKPTTLSGYGITDGCTIGTAQGLLYEIAANGAGAADVRTYGGTTKYTIDWSHQHSFFELLDRPTTLDGYGITGGKLSGSLYVMGRLGVGTTAPSCALQVEGDIAATGGLTALTHSTVSDVRKKDVLGDVVLTVEQIAEAPAVRFIWKEHPEMGEQVGSIAQYWQKVLPQSVRGSEQLSLQYDTTGLVAIITLARRVMQLEKTINELRKDDKQH